MMLSLIKYSCPSINWHIQSTTGIVLSITTSLTVVELLVFSFWHTKTDTAPLLSDKVSPVWLLMLWCIAKDASTLHLITCSYLPVVFGSLYFNLSSRWWCSSVSCCHQHLVPTRMCIGMPLGSEFLDVPIYIGNSGFWSTVEVVWVSFVLFHCISINSKYVLFCYSACLLSFLFMMLLNKFSM